MSQPVDYLERILTSRVYDVSVSRRSRWPTTCRTASTTGSC